MFYYQANPKKNIPLVNISNDDNTIKEKIYCNSCKILVSQTKWAGKYVYMRPA